MATGDKRAVVMGEEKGAAGGVATLGADGILAQEQRPNIEQLYSEDGTKTIKQLFEDKAPGGKGYGDVMDAVVAETMEDYCGQIDAIAAQMKDFTTKQIITAGPGMFGAGRYLATIYRQYAAYVVVIGFSNAGVSPFSTGWRLVKENGVWRQIEWDNPPMQLGVEYRTTERYLGKPVYAKCFNIGALPNSAAFDYTHGIANIDKIPVIFGEKWNRANNATGGGMFGDSGVTVFRANKTEVKVTTTTDLSGNDCYVTMKYTKVTD